jgi:hypothetical protein
MMAGLSGIDLAMLQRCWCDYDPQRAAVLSQSRPAALLPERYSDAAGDIEAIEQAARTTTARLHYLSLRSRQVADWVSMVVEPGARVVGHLHQDGYF